MKKHRLFLYLNNQQGVSAVIIAICLIMLVGFIALAIDVGHLYVARNELQNAADAGALAGAMELFTADMTAINPNANQIANDVAISNIADGSAVEVKDPLSNNGDVQRGHWSLQTRTFTPNPSLVFVSLSGKSWNELDADTNFINAVRLRTRREATPITSFFARIFERMGFIGVTEAVAYVGPAGSEMTAEIDAPVAICAQSVVQPNGEDPDPFDPTNPPPEDPCWLNDGWGDCKVLCSSGRMLDSGADTGGPPTSSHNTAAWINFTTEDIEGGCSQASSNTMRDVVCKSSDALPDTVDKKIEVGDTVGSTGGVEATIYKDVRQCWEGTYFCMGEEDDQGVCAPEDRQYLDSDIDPDDVPDWSWKMKLPVIDCPGNNVTGCPEVVGVICVELLWMTRTGEPDPSVDTPFRMKTWYFDENGEIIIKKSWDVDNSDIPLLDTSFADLEDVLKSQQDPNKPTPLSKYFEPEKIQCPGVDLLTTLGVDEIPAPLSLTGTPTNLGSFFQSVNATLGSLFAGESTQVNITTAFLQTPEPPYDAYNPENICNEQELYEAFKHRQADAAGMGRWYSFVKNFNLRTYDGRLASVEKKTMYYAPDCECDDQGLGTGGIFLGILAKEPVLVR
jgi:hypothetical protein